jgi:biofilm PGA synthesis N-glycosyltransferase PgaC
MLQTLLLSSVVAAVALLAVVVAGAVGFALKRGGRRSDSNNDRKALAGSRFTMPVTLIVPLDADAPPPDETVAALLRLNYPELEVIVVTDGAASAALDSLKSTWALSACEFFYRRTLPSRDVQRMYKSGRDARLLVAEKVAAGRADSLNCGVNLSRYPYLCVVDTGISFDADALFRAMAVPLTDPSVVAASCHVERRVDDGAPISRDAARQWLASSRALLESGVLWRSSAHGVGPEDSVVAWRRDAVVQAGGFSGIAADPDLDLMTRLQAEAGHGENRVRPVVARTADIFGVAAPRPRSSLGREAARRQQAVLQVLAGWLRGARPGWPTMAYFAACRLVAPLCAAWVIVGTLIGAVAGWFAWSDVGLAVVMLSLGHASITTAALLVRGAAPRTPAGVAFVRLLWLAPSELILYGPSSAAARAAGFWRAIRG